MKLSATQTRILDELRAAGNAGLEVNFSPDRKTCKSLEKRGLAVRLPDDGNRAFWRAYDHEKLREDAKKWRAYVHNLDIGSRP